MNAIIYLHLLAPVDPSLLKGLPGFDDMMASHFDGLDPSLVRSVILGRVEAVMTSCGYGVPRYRYLGQRETLGRWAVKKGDQGELEAYVAHHMKPSEEIFPVEPPTGS